MTDRSRAGDHDLDLPSHPEADGERPDPGSTTTSWSTVLGFVVVGVVVVVMAILHLTGVVGPMAH